MSFFSSMFITNDVALITFVPFTIAVLYFAGKGNLLFVTTMQTMPANLGSMLTPVGNPQNLYLYSFFNLRAMDFFYITMPIMLSGFTKNYAMLIAGTNIGGLGTMVASLASLISFKLYLSSEDAEPVRYLGVFTAANLIMLGAIIAFALAWY